MSDHCHPDTLFDRRATLDPNPFILKTRPGMFEGYIECHEASPIAPLGWGGFVILIL